MQKHYNNKNGSLYKFAENHNLNSYEFDIIKRVMRCRKKGTFLEDLKKTKFLIDLYIKEEQEKENPNQTNILEQIEELNTPQGSIEL
jgi:hypothetical protein